jgi:hypothetical protein
LEVRARQFAGPVLPADQIGDLAYDAVVLGSAVTPANGAKRL